MFPEVHSALRLDQRSDGSSALVAIEEEEDQLGAFLVHHFLVTSIKNRRKVVFIGLEQSLGHYSAVALKNGINLHKFRDTGQLVFIEGLKNYADAYLGDAGDGFDFIAKPRDRQVLKQLYKRVEQEVNRLNTAASACASTTVIVDKLSVLLSLGVPSNDVVIFARYLQSMVQKSQGCEVVLLTRRDPDDVDEALNSVSAYLARSSDLVVRCWPLCSGKSSSVTGNLCFEWSDGACETGRFQFRLEEKTVRVFALGASRDVL